MSKDEPAFPLADHNRGMDGSFFDAGMSIRDYIACHALTGIIAANYDTTPTDVYKTFSERAYKFADAMMEARKL